MTTMATATMEGPMPYVDSFGEPPLLDDIEKIARMEIVDSKNPKHDDDMFSIPSEDFAAYRKQVFESDGFDIDFYHPGFAFVFGVIQPVYNSKEELAEEFGGYAEFAIKEYNKNKGEDFKVVGIEKVNEQASGNFNLYITFAAVDKKALDDEPKMFQALVALGILHKRTVELCRQKGDPSEGYYTDFGRSIVAKV